MARWQASDDPLRETGSFCPPRPSLRPTEARPAVFKNAGKRSATGRAEGGSIPPRRILRLYTHRASRRSAAPHAYRTRRRGRVFGMRGNRGNPFPASKSAVADFDTPSADLGKPAIGERGGGEGPPLIVGMRWRRCGLNLIGQALIPAPLPHGRRVPRAFIGRVGLLSAAPPSPMREKGRGVAAPVSSILRRRRPGLDRLPPRIGGAGGRTGAAGAGVS